MIRVLIADDHELVRAGLRALLERTEDIQVVGEAQDGQEAVELAKQVTPDVILMDLAMPRLSGHLATEQIRALGLASQVIILSIYSDATLVRQALRARARGYLVKQSVKEELALAIRAAARGELFLSSAVSGILVEQALHSAEPEEADPFECLCTKAMQVLALVVQGHPNHVIADRMHISLKTVERHCSNFTAKLQVHDLASFVRRAMKHGPIPLNEKQ